MFGVPKCSGSVWGLPGMGGRAGPDSAHKLGTQIIIN